MLDYCLGASVDRRYLSAAPVRQVTNVCEVGHLWFRLHRIWPVILGFLVAFLAAGCDPWQAITYVNQMPEEVKVALRGVPMDYAAIPTLRWADPGDILEAGQSKRMLTSVSTARNERLKYTVVAVTETNEIVLARIFTWDELHDSGWKVIITPSVDGD
jgi:hypothetical protein